MSPQLLQQIEQSPLQLMAYRLFMHYFSPEATPNPSDQAWKNQGIFFWDVDEPFERKSLPPVFQTYQKLFFYVQAEIPNVSVMQMTTIPWFGMPGGGTKYAFTLNEKQEIPLQELSKQGMIQYLQIFPINENTAHLLQKRGEYYFFMDVKKVQYKDRQFYFEGQAVEFSEAVRLGGFRLVKPIN